jgi:hypothetical protein
VTAPSPTNVDPSTQRRCAACTHAWNSHDEIAARFCAATVVNSYLRGCVCGPSAALADSE